MNNRSEFIQKPTFGFRPAMGLACCIALLVFIGFRVDSSRYREHGKQAIEAVLRNESSVANSYSLAKSLADLELIGSVSCIQLVEHMETTRIFYDTSTAPGCLRGSWAEVFFSSTVKLQSISGTSYVVKYQSPIRYSSLMLELLLYVAIFGSLSFYSVSYNRRELLHRAQLTNQKLESELLVTRAKVLNDLALQVSHDIRSPLAVLNAVVHHTQNLDEETRVQIRQAVQRIRDTANGLLNKGGRAKSNLNEDSNLNSFSSEGNTPELLSALLLDLISEKRIQFAKNEEVEIVADGLETQTAFAKIQKAEFARVFSNLINNAVEAVGERGEIRISMMEDPKQVKIVISDNGKGMSQETLQNLGERGFTQGKDQTESGSGLGVHHAFKTLEAWGGSLRFESQPSRGTVVTMTLRRVGAPAWFAENLEVKPSSTVVVLDDDPGIQEVWNRRFASYSHVSIKNFSQSTELTTWYRQELGVVKDPLYLCDLELIGSKETGLDVIEKLGVAQDAILVTSRWDEPEVRARCEKHGVRLLPKLLAGSIPILAT